MKKSYVLKTVGLGLCSFLLVYAGFIATHHSSYQSNNENILEEKIDLVRFSQIEPTKYNKTHFIRVEVAVKDDLQIPNGKISEVKINGDKLLLRPADHSGSRGSTFLRLKPGKMFIKWYVKKNKYAYPRKMKHAKEINITDSTYWIHILIEGNNITIN